MAVNDRTTFGGYVTFMPQGEPRPYYTDRQLPPFVEGTTGLIATPNRRRSIIAIPVTSAINLAMGVGDEAYQVPVRLGDWHIAYNGNDNHHRGVGYSISPKSAEQTHEQLGEADPNRDPRAAFLRGYWVSLGLRSTIMELRRIAPARVVGQIAEEAHNSRMQITGGWFTLHMGMFLLASPFDPAVMWLTTNENMHYEFSTLNAPGANGQPGEQLAAFE